MSKWHELLLIMQIQMHYIESAIIGSSSHMPNCGRCIIILVFILISQNHKNILLKCLKLIPRNLHNCWNSSGSKITDLMQCMNMKSLMPNLNQKLNMEIWLKSKYNTLSKCYRIHAFKNPKDLKALMGPCTCPKLGLTKYSYSTR